jgi:hypothetical protein
MRTPPKDGVIRDNFKQATPLAFKEFLALLQSCPSNVGTEIILLRGSKLTNEEVLAD